MSKVKKIFILLICIVSLVAIVILTIDETNKIYIGSIEPKEITAGQDFCIYEGRSTMSIKGRGFKKGDVIYLNGTPQESAVGNNKWMTCFVDKKVYDKKGNVKVEIRRIGIDGKEISKSNSIKVDVK